MRVPLIFVYACVTTYLYITFRFPTKPWKHRGHSLGRGDLFRDRKLRATILSHDQEEMNMEFSRSMNPINLSKWLLKDAGRHYQEDIVKLKGTYASVSIRSN